MSTGMSFQIITSRLWPSTAKLTAEQLPKTMGHRVANLIFNILWSKPKDASRMDVYGDINGLIAEHFQLVGFRVGGPQGHSLHAGRNWFIETNEKLPHCDWTQNLGYDPVSWFLSAPSAQVW